MKYQGGKGRTAKKIVEVAIARAPGKTRWVEPFVGGTWVLEAAHRSGRFRDFHAGDTHKDAVMLYQAVASGWDPPSRVSRDEFMALKKAPASAMRALAGFGSSYGGTYFAGYCGDSLNGRKTNSEIAAEHLRRRQPIYQATEIRCCDYREWSDVIGPDTLLYCDPPYANTRHDSYQRGFKSAEFWAWCSAMRARGAEVFISEYDAPGFAEEVWSLERKQTLARFSNKTVKERLFRIP